MKATKPFTILFILALSLSSAPMMRHHPATAAEPQVSADLTSRIDVALTQTAIELGSGIEVVAERPLIRRDVTYTARIMSGAEVAKTAGTEGLSEVLELEPSVVRDVRSDEIHLRGGRGDEILYVIDGLPVNDKLVGGGTQLEIPVGEVEEVEIITGGFNAEYGEAQSGVVNVVTKGGFSQETGELLYKSDKIAPGDIAGAKRDYVAFNLAGPEPLTGYLLPAIGVRPGGSSGSYTTLTPRQELTPVANAIFASSAATASSCAASAASLRRK